MKRTLLFFLILFLSTQVHCVTPPESEDGNDVNSSRFMLHYNMGIAHLDSNEPSYAMEKFLEAEKYMTPPELYYVMGQACFMLMRLDLALEYFDKALMEDSNFSLANVSKGIVHIEMGQYEVSIVEFNKALENIIFHEPETAYYNMGIAYMKMNDIETAIKYMELAIGVKPEYLPPYIQLGKIFTDLGDYESAADNYIEILRYYPQFPEAHFMLGEVYLKLEQDSLAMMEFREVINLAPDSRLAEEAARYLTGEEN